MPGFGVRSTPRTDFAPRLNCRTQASQVLHIERAQSRHDSSPDPDDAFFHAWPKHRDPKFAAKAQLGPPHRRRASRTSRAVEVHLFCGCDVIMHVVASTGNWTRVTLV